MKKYELLYDWPIAECCRVTDSQQAEDYANTLQDGKLDRFIALTEQIRNCYIDLQKARAAKQHVAFWPLLRTHFEAFHSDFADFPALRPGKMIIHITLAAAVAQSAPPIDEEDLGDTPFEIRLLPNRLPEAWFYRENLHSFEDSLVLFATSDLAALANDVSQANIAPRFALHLLGAILAAPELLSGHYVAVKKVAPQIEIQAVEAFVKLNLLMSGKALHSSRPFVNPPSLIDIDKAQAGHPYQQWNDVFHVMSEYNTRTDILLKYLTLYHVIENLMFKLPIVELESQKSGHMFTIRDFRRLYRRVEETEIEALKRLMRAVVGIPIGAGKTFGQHIVRRWKALVPSVPSADIEQALGALDIKKNGRPLRHSELRTDGELHAHFAQMVYAIRCAIVHNKETEFHLTYHSLDATLSAIIETFLLPSLEELCFTLVGSPNQLVWYTSKALVLCE